MSNSTIEAVMGYDPNEGASIFLTIMFGLLLMFLTAQIYTQAKRFTEEHPYVKSKKLKISNIPILLGVLVYFVSCILRCASISKGKSMGLNQMINLYVAENVLLYVAPTFYSVTVLLYFEFIIHWLDFTDLQNKFTFRFFFYSDMIARILQIVGSSNLSSNYHAGSSVLVAGLFVQIALFSYFIFLQVKFNQHHYLTSNKDIAAHIKMFSINFATMSVLIIIRNIIRVIGYLAHRGNYLNVQEWVFYVFTTLPLFLIPFIFGIINCKYNIFSFKTLVLEKTAREQEDSQTMEEQV